MASRNKKKRWTLLSSKLSRSKSSSDDVEKASQEHTPSKKTEEDFILPTPQNLRSHNSIANLGRQLIDERLPRPPTPPKSTARGFGRIKTPQVPDRTTSIRSKSASNVHVAFAPQAPIPPRDPGRSFINALNGRSPSSPNLPASPSLPLPQVTKFSEAKDTDRTGSAPLLKGHKSMWKLKDAISSRFTKLGAGPGRLPKSKSSNLFEHIEEEERLLPTTDLNDNTVRSSSLDIEGTPKLIIDDNVRLPGVKSESNPHHRGADTSYVPQSSQAVPSADQLLDVPVAVGKNRPPSYYSSSKRSGLRHHQNTAWFARAPAAVQRTLSMARSQSDLSDHPQLLRYFSSSASHTASVQGNFDLPASMSESKLATGDNISSGPQDSVSTTTEPFPRLSWLSSFQGSVASFHGSISSVLKNSNYSGSPRSSKSAIDNNLHSEALDPIEDENEEDSIIDEVARRRGGSKRHGLAWFGKGSRAFEGIETHMRKGHESKEHQSE